MFYSRSLLEQRIKEEIFRTYRIGSPFSLVLFNPAKLMSASFKNKKKAIKKIIEFLDQETRETDIKGWWDKNKIAVLLLDTRPEDAALLVDKLLSRMQTYDRNLVKSVEEASFEILAFPNTRCLQPSVNDETEEKDSKISNQKSNQNFRKMDFSTIPPNDNSLIQCGFKKHQELIKRCLDIIVSAAGLIILSPLFLLCAILIKLDSSGPVFYRQARVSKGGKCFTFLKFRSMQHNADEEIHKNHVKNLMDLIAGLSSDGPSGERSYKLTEDARVTRMGKFLRRTSIDELPQLINVLRGDMSLVGPRPHPIYEVEQYTYWHSHRLDVKPGITGLGQIYGRFNTEYADVYRLDLQYLKRPSLILDLHILLKTIPLVLSGRGAF